MRQGWSRRDGSEWPQREKATIKWQSGDHAGQLKKLRRGNRRVTRAKRKNCGAAINGSRASKKKNRGATIGVSRWPKEKCSAVIDGLRQPKEKITAWQSIDCAGQKENHSTAIDGLRRPKEKSRRGNQQIAPAKRKNLRCGNQSIAPAKRKIAARKSGYRTCLFKNLHKA